MTLEPPRPVVPGPVAVVRDFVNTTDHETGTDDIATTTALTRYLLRERLLSSAAVVSADDLTLAHGLRSGLRRALELNHDGATGAAPELREALRALPVQLDWNDERPVLQPHGSGVRAALARIGVAAHQAASDGVWWRLKICSSDTCEWAYYDNSKNRSRTWCEYGCGNKEKTRAYRARQRAKSS
jgi:predicted RNA-binding Zn ribbon-like protein